MTAHDETLVRDVLQRTTDDLTAPLPSLTAAATVHGRRLRRRRRALATTGGLCAAALVAVPVFLSLGGSTKAGSVATDPTPTPSAPPTSSAAPPHLVDNDSWATMPAADMATTFEGLAPAGVGLTDVMLTNVDRAPGEAENDSPGYLLASITTDGALSGRVNLTLTVTGFSDATYTCPGTLRRFESCTEILGKDGQPIGRRWVTTSGDVVQHSVALLRKNGGLVYVDATNATSQKWGWGSPVAGPTVPLTLDQLQAIAEDDAWIGYEPPAGG
jgi:hypothetical protein